MQAAPMLSSPPAFVLLAMLVGLGAYLRQVAEAQDKLLEEIANGRLPTYPPGADHTNEKAKHLEISRSRLSRIAPVVISLTALIAVRLALQSASDLFGWTRLFCFERDVAFRSLDLIVCFSIVLIVGALWVMHNSGKNKDEKIRAQVKQWRQQRTNTPEETAYLAYLYWIGRGRQGGSPETDWLMAEHELRRRRVLS